MRRIAPLLPAVLALAACGDNTPAEPEPPPPPPPPPEPGDRDRDGVLDASDCAPDDATRWELGPAFVDADGDRVGAGDVTSACGGSAPPVGHALVSGDCDDAAADRQHLHLYAFRDGDLDGRFVAQAGQLCAPGLPAGYVLTDPGTEPDCADGDGTRFQTAALFPDVDRDHVGFGIPSPLCIGDEVPEGWASVDGDCAAGDIARWQTLAYTHRDTDGDHRYVAAPGTLCSGAALEDGYLAADPGTEPDCAPGDITHWQLIAYAFVDGDGDDRYVGATGTRCSGAALDDGYLATDPGTEPDCAPGDIHRWDERTAYPDGDGDHVGVLPGASVCVGNALDEGWAAVAGDCAADDIALWRYLPYTHRDHDLDEVTIAEAGVVCSGASLPPRFLTAGNGDDCDDDDELLWWMAPLYDDGDRDGVGAGATTQTCIGGTAPVGTSLVGTDCAVEDKLAWRYLPYTHADHDDDGATIPETGQQCAGDAVVPPFYTAAQGNDCNDGDGTLTRWVALYRDVDDDGVGTTPRQIHCLGDAVPEGWSRRGDDVDDGDPLIVEDEEEDEVLELLLGLS